MVEHVVGPRYGVISAPERAASITTWTCPPLPRAINLPNRTEASLCRNCKRSALLAHVEFHLALLKRHHMWDVGPRQRREGDMSNHHFLAESSTLRGRLVAWKSFVPMAQSNKALTSSRRMMLLCSQLAPGVSDKLYQGHMPLKARGRINDG